MGHYVGIDLHRRRSVIVVLDEEGEELWTRKIDNTPENLERWVRNPRAVKPGALMVVPELDDETVRRIVAYLQSLK